ncbi:MAG TPA: CusA/CzcA family heavy metal efflux RND transporter [Planctomycetota bacterium]
MIGRLIEFSVRNRFFVLLVALMVAGLGVWAAANIRLDAIPDLSDVQVIVVTDVPGQSPQVVDDQVTYPLTTAMLSVPGSTYVRGYSMFELSFVYVLFEDGTDLYWARSRVLEALNVARERLPKGVAPRLGPDATGVGWVYQYVLHPGWYCPDHPKTPYDVAGVCPVEGRALVPAKQDLASLRSLQDWQLRYPLTSVEGVSEVASIGGYVKQYQVTLDPARLLAYRLPLKDIVMAIERSNNDVGGAVLEISENEYMVRSRGYLNGLADLGVAPVGLGANGAPVLLRDVATLEIGGEARRGVGEWNGEGEAVGGVVVSRFGENAYKVIRDVKAKLADLAVALPPGVSIKTTYDRSALIERAVDTLTTGVVEELIVVGLICLIFLMHVRSALVAILVLPLGLLVSLLVMRLLGINANIMSIGGLALAIGVMVDSAVVMVENAHEHLQDPRNKERGRIDVLLEAAKEVGPSLFISLLVITVSFLPIFALGEESGRLFKPLAFTKTFAIAAGALLGVTVVPVLMVFLIRGRIPSEEANPLNRWSQALYGKIFHLVMARPWVTVAVALLAGVSTIYPFSKIGSEFMPPLDEGDLLYMPTTDPSVSILKSREILQQTDKLIKTFPEVESVHGKIGRAETATDPAPLSMVETVVRLKTDEKAWRRRKVARWFSPAPGWLKWPLTVTFWPEERPITTEELVHGWTEPDGIRHPGLNETVSLPGMANAWPYPIENRLNMLSTGIKTPVGIKVMGADLEALSAVAERVAVAVGKIQGTLSAYPERTMGGLYLDIEVKRDEAARYGLTVGDVQDVVTTAIGGMNVTTTVEGLERYPVNVRYARELREDIPALKSTLVTTPAGAQIPIGQLAELAIRPGPPMIRSENAQRTAWVFVDIAGRDLGGYVKEAKEVVRREVALPAGTTLVWSGRFEALEKTNARLLVVVPITALLIVMLLYVSNRSWLRVGLVTIPWTLIGVFWLLWAIDYNLSLAVWVGVIALLGVDAETGQVMLLYLDQAIDRRRREGRLKSAKDLYDAMYEGAVKRIRPKTMTVATDLIGLLPLLWTDGSGADVTRRMIAPLVGGILISFLGELLVTPALFYLARRRQLRKEWAV